MDAKFNLPFRPLKMNTPTRKSGYYAADIVGAKFEIPPDKGALRVDYIIPNGKYAGFALHSRIDPLKKGNAVLSHLLNAVGLFELNDAKQLIGRRLTLRVVARWNPFARRYTHIITHFHQLKKNKQPEAQ